MRLKRKPMPPTTIDWDIAVGECDRCHKTFRYSASQIIGAPGVSHFTIKLICPMCVRDFQRWWLDAPR